jgi:hypothetical protein
MLRGTPVACSIGWRRVSGDRVFMDVTDIAPGEDFTPVIETNIGAAELLVAVIGPQWISATDEKGTRRIDQPSDLVRQELAAALQGKVRVIPVLVRGARMPREDELPDALKALARRQAVELFLGGSECPIRAGYVTTYDPRRAEGRSSP